MRAHLVNVYRTLALGLGCASVGVYADFTGFTATYLPLFKYAPAPPRPPAHYRSHANHPLSTPSSVAAGS